MTRLSNSQINTYLTCGRKYNFHYNKRLRSKVTSGALLFGTAIDLALNDLLLNKNLESAIKIFDENWEYGWINKKKEHLPESNKIVYAKKDFDEELLLEEDRMKLGLFVPERNPLDFYQGILNQKETSGFENLTESNKKFYNLANWIVLRRKGHLFLKAYKEKILPQIKQVYSIQKEFNLTGKDNDVVNGFIDFIVEFHDGKQYVMDNKTSTREYESDAASKSKQLILYYYVENRERKASEQKLLDGTGFVVLYKQIQKNRTKICLQCGNDGTGGRHKTCDKMLIGSLNDEKPERCNGTWKETIKPQARVEMILNEVKPSVQNLVIQTLLGANEGIKKGVFGPNLESCEKYGKEYRCQFYNKCWHGNEEDLVTLEKKNDT